MASTGGAATIEAARGSGSRGGGSDGDGGNAGTQQQAARRRRQQGQDGSAPETRKRRGAGSGGSGGGSGAYARLVVLEGVGPDPRVCTFDPPSSPFGLIEEELFDDPWKLLLACMLLNKTSGKQVRQVIWDLLDMCPTPQAAIAADQAAIRDLIRPLGLFNKRAAAVQRFSREYLDKQWTCPTQLHGIGKYAADAYYMFCRGRWREVEPDDKDLKRYRDWLASTGGLGSGLQRAVPWRARDGGGNGNTAAATGRAPPRAAAVAVAVAGVSMGVGVACAGALEAGQ